MHRWSVLIMVQWDATKSSLFIILRVHSTCFGCQPHPSSGEHKTVTRTSGTVQAKIGHVGGRQLHSTAWTLPEAVVTVLCTLDDGCGWHPKHVEWTHRIINRLFCAASRCTIINIKQYISFRKTLFLFPPYTVSQQLIGNCQNVKCHFICVVASCRKISYAVSEERVAYIPGWPIGFMWLPKRLGKGNVLFR